jgi:hypothetical protein
MKKMYVNILTLLLLPALCACSPGSSVKQQADNEKACEQPGYIGLQDHGYGLAFRNIRIKELKE